MNFTINSDVLAKHISTISKAQSNKNALPILDSILIEQNGGKVTLTASDAENYFTCTLDVTEYDGSMKIALNSKMLSNSIREIADQPITIETNDGKNVTIHYQNGKYNLMSDDAAIYPENTLREGQSISFVMDSETIKDGLGRCIWAVANDELRPQMNGVYLDTCKEGIVMVASDGHKLVRDIFPNPDNILNASFIILPKTIKILQGILGKEAQTVSIQVTERKSSATFFIGEYILSCRLAEGKFPSYNSVIPQGSPFIALVDKEALRSAAGRVHVCASTATPTLKLHFADNTLTISAKDLDFSTSAEEKMNVDYNASPFSIGLNGNFLKQMLGEMPGDTVKISMSEPSRAAVFEPEGGDDNANGENILMLLMPMMLQD